MIKIQFASDTNVGKVRTNNEDYHLPGSTKNGDVFIVCDGMGGHAAGEVASQMTANSVFEFLNAEIYDDIPNAIRNAIRYANKKVIEYTQQNPETKGMGTTIVMALIKDDKIYIAHVGDSRAYYVSNGKIYFLTRDHSLVQSLVDAGIITEQQALTDPRKNQINQAIGIEKNLKIDINIINPIKGDQILLSSDGLSDLVEPEKVAEILKFQIPEKEKITLLIDSALNKGGKDNITVILININESPHVTPSFNHFTPNYVLEAQGIAPKKNYSDTQPDSKMDKTVDRTNFLKPQNNLKKFYDKFKPYIFGATSIIIIAIILISIFGSKKSEVNFVYIQDSTKQEISKSELLKKINTLTVNDTIYIRFDSEHYYKFYIKNKDTVESAIISIQNETPKNSYMEFYGVSKNFDISDTVFCIVAYTGKIDTAELNKIVKKNLDFFIKKETDVKEIVKKEENPLYKPHKDTLEEDTTKTDTSLNQSTPPKNDSIEKKETELKSDTNIDTGVDTTVENIGKN